MNYIIKFNVQIFLKDNNHLIEGEYKIKRNSKVFSEEENRVIHVEDIITAKDFFLTSYKNAELLYLNPNFLSEFVDISNINCQILDYKLSVVEVIILQS